MSIKLKMYFAFGQKIRNIGNMYNISFKAVITQLHILNN